MLDLEKFKEPIKDFFDENVTFATDRWQPKGTYEDGIAYASKFEYSVNNLELLEIIDRAITAEKAVELMAEMHFDKTDYKCSQCPIANNCVGNRSDDRCKKLLIDCFMEKAREQE